MAYITSSGAENFGTLNAGVNITITHIAIIAAFGVTTGAQNRQQILLGTKALAAAREYVAGDELILPAGSLDINIPNGELNDAAVLEAWTAWLALKNPPLTALLGTNAMGTAGTSNEVSTSRGYSRQQIEYSIALGSAPTS